MLGKSFLPLGGGGGVSALICPFFGEWVEGADICSIKKDELLFFFGLLSLDYGIVYR